MLEAIGTRALAERLKLIEERLSIGTWSWDRQTDEVAWSPGLYRLLGVEPNAVSPSLNFFESLTHPDDRLPFHDDERIATDARQRNRRFRLIRPDGGLRWIWSVAQTIFDRSGEISRVIAVAADTTELEETKSALVSTQEFDKAIANLLRMEFWKADEDGNLIEASNWVKDYGPVPHSVYAQGWQSIVPPEEHDHLRQAWSRAMAEQTEYSQSHSIRLANGTMRTVHVRGVPFVDRLVNKRRWVGVATLEGGIAAPATPKPWKLPLGVLPAQIRAARAYLGWSAEYLARRAGVSLSTVRRLEKNADHAIRETNMHAIIHAFQAAGLSFWSDYRGRSYFVAG